MDLLLLINGELVDSKKKLEVTNPVNGKVIGTVPYITKEQTKKSIEFADKAFKKWSKTTLQERSKILKKASDIIKESSEYLAGLLTKEHGKPLSDARKEINGSAEVLEYYSKVVLDIEGEIPCSSSNSSKSFVFGEPIGVIAAIAAWNYPVSLIAWKIAPALAAGCTVLVKPPKYTPLALTEFIRLCASAGFPAGALNVVFGSHDEVGNELFTNPLVKKIAFTGSTATGKKIAQTSASSLKKLNLELGGHSPFVVFEDTNFEKALKDGVKRSFRNMGQICNAVNRIYVQESIYDKYVSSFVEATEKMTIGDGFANPNVDLGPMVDKSGIATAEDHISDALSKGAVLKCGGKRPNKPELKQGNFFEPTVLVNANSDMKIMNEETFGPVVAIDKFKTIEEAIDKANSTNYGLVSYVYTQNLNTAFKLCSGIESGSIAVNSVNPDTLYAPYGGWKESGYGVELSKHAIEQYLQYKHVKIDFE
jgi:acyl-CoA reductase-like NAD-dependent aldehyde dehydrogenase